MSRYTLDIEQKEKSPNLDVVSLDYPISVLHQVWVQELEESPKIGPRDGILLPEWLFKKAALVNGERVVLTRENNNERPVEALRNRTVAPVFSWDNNHIKVLGPAATFLGKKGPSCLIAYSSSKGVDDITAIDLNFPYSNRDNKEIDLTVKSVVNGRKLEGIEDTIYDLFRKTERKVLIASISGLKVEVGDPYCNPRLAQIPFEIMQKAGLPRRNIKASFVNQSRPLQALDSYIVPNDSPEVTQSGALFGAFPTGDRFVINVYGTIKGDVIISPTLVHVNM